MITLKAQHKEAIVEALRIVAQTMRRFDAEEQARDNEHLALRIACSKGVCLLMEEEGSIVDASRIADEILSRPREPKKAAARARRGMKGEKR